MSEVKNLDDLLKIPLSVQANGIYDKLLSRKKELFKYFYDKTKTVEDRNSVFDEANKIANYLNETPIKWRATKPKGNAAPRIIPTEDRIKNCDAFKKYLSGIGINWDKDLEDSHKAVILSNIWGPTS